MINALAIIPGKTDYCPTMGDLAIKKRVAVPWKNRRKGDIVLFDFNRNGTSDHIGLVISVNSDGSITTIEGNTGSGSNTNGGQVQKRARYKSQVNFLVRPKYNKEVTAEMVIATAKDELGITESPSGSNKVKYNRWYYGKNISAFWCATFVCWVFAHVKTEEDRKPKPGTYTGDFPTKTLQKGSKGSDVRKWQKFLKWMGYDLEADSDFGSITKKYTIKAQKAFGLKGKEVDGIVGPQTIKKAKSYVKPVKPEKTVKKKTETAPKTAKTLDIRALKKVVDISYWQSTSDLLKAKADGVDGVIIRTSYTSQAKFSLNSDSRFKMHLEHAIKAGLPIGVYHYSQAITEKEAKKEAKYIIKIIKPYKDKISLPVVFDWEFGGRLNSSKAKNLGKNKCSAIVSAYCDTVKNAGFTPMVYANYNTFANYLNKPDLAKKYLIWLAQYSKTASMSYDIWQYTSSGSIKGLTGRIDVSKGCGINVSPKTVPEKAVDWALKIASSGEYGYKLWDNKDDKTKQCPICHKLTGRYKAWNCIGFVTACYYHGGGLKQLKCSCSGIGTNGFFEGITLAKWKSRNGTGWHMITNGGAENGKSIPASSLKKGDICLCYDGDGKWHHVVMYIGDGRYIDCTNTSKIHIGVRKYSDLTAKRHVTRAFRYIG